VGQPSQKTWGNEADGMTKTAAIIQIVLIVLVVGYGTFHLFQGNFEQTYLTFPLLILYWVFFVARKRRAEMDERQEQDEQ
jgi:amino acid permease